MKYLLEFPPSYPSPIQGLTPDQLAEGKARLKKGIEDGSVDCAYSKVGGGAVMVVNAKNHETLTRILRGYRISHIEVTPLVEMADVIDGYAEWHAANKSA